VQYWLMKSEPDTFSIDDLIHMKKQTSPWDGVRNFKARNYLREMQVGDLAFFYHSSCAVPAIMGIVTITRAAYPDPSAWDPASPYYDPNSTPRKTPLVDGRCDFQRKINRSDNAKRYQTKSKTRRNDVSTTRQSLIGNAGECCTLENYS